jgi:thiol-disulfide isomerase/thioredoxin
LQPFEILIKSGYHVPKRRQLMAKVLARYAISIAVALILPLSWYSHEGHGASAKHKHPQATKNPHETIIIKRDMEIEDCEGREMGDYVIFIYSRYCPHCKKAMPVVEEIVTKQKIGSRYLPIDTTTEEGRDLLNQFGIRVQYVPTLIKDCKAHVGAKKDAEYEEILTGKKNK